MLYRNGVQYRMSDEDKQKVGVPIQRPTLKDIYWMAGFLEGEGTFVLDKGNSLCVSICQVNREPLDKVMKLFGGRYTYLERSGNRRYFMWRVFGPRAIGLALTVYSLMSTKRQKQIQNNLPLARY